MISTAQRSTGRQPVGGLYRGGCPKWKPGEALEQLEEEERAVSTRRRRLHDKIDFLKTTGVEVLEVAERLARLVEEEHELSQRRRELHALIDEPAAVELGIEALGPPKRESHAGQVARPRETG